MFTHGVGLLGAIAATPVLVVGAVRTGGAGIITGSSVFGAAMILLYLASTGYHAAPPGALKDRLRRVDHAAIYLLIAGTYTPFTLGVLGGPWGWTLFGVVWGMAALGASTKLAVGIRRPGLSTALYLGMGWLILVAIVPVVRLVPAAGLAWLFAGGLMYTIGAGFFAAPRMRWGHVVWHVFVMAGSACHFFAVLRYAA